MRSQRGSEFFQARPAVVARLILPGLFGYVFPIADEPSAIFRKTRQILQWKSLATHSSREALS